MKKGLRAVSIATLVCFLTTQCAWGAPGASIELVGARELPGYLSIDVPAEFGTVDALYEAPASANPQFVLHIQNAHANYQAQMKIKQLLGYINKKYGFKTIFVEGASEKLDADYLRLFPDEERNLKLCDELAKQGELTGAELYLMEAGKDIEALGIEQAALYRSNYDALKKVFGAEADVNRFFKGFDGKLGRVASKTFTPETRELIADWKRFEQGRREFMPFVKTLAQKSKKILNVDLESLFAQVGWPQITRLLVIQQMEKELDRAKGVAEKETLLKMLREKGASKELVAAVENFSEGSISVGKSTQEVSPREVLERLAAEMGPKGFKFSDYPAFSLYAGYVTLRFELDAKVLFEEIEYLFTQILDTLATEPEQKTLLALYRDGELLRKLLHLELNRAQWREVSAAQDRIAVPSLISRLKEVVIESGDKTVQKDQEVMPKAFSIKMSEIFNAGIEFYGFARQRESVFYKEMQTAMSERKITKAVLITGGFHTDGMSDLFRENAVSYGIVTPRLSEKSNENLYRRIMLQDEQVPFNLSYLEAAPHLADLITIENQGLVPLDSLKPILKQFIDVGNFGNLNETAIAAFNAITTGPKYNGVKVTLELSGDYVKVNVMEKAIEGGVAIEFGPIVRSAPEVAAKPAIDRAEIRIIPKQIAPIVLASVIGLTTAVSALAQRAVGPAYYVNERGEQIVIPGTEVVPEEILVQEDEVVDISQGEKGVFFNGMKFTFIRLPESGFNLTVNDNTVMVGRLLRLVENLPGSISTFYLRSLGPTRTEIWYEALNRKGQKVKNKITVRARPGGAAERFPSGAMAFAGRSELRNILQSGPVVLAVLLAPMAANAFTTNNVPTGTELIDAVGVVDERSPTMTDIARIGNKPAAGSVMSTNMAVTNFNWNVIAQDKLGVPGEKWAVLSSVGDTPGGASFNVFTNDFIRNATNLVLGIIGRPKIAPPAAPTAPAMAPERTYPKIAPRVIRPKGSAAGRSELRNILQSGPVVLALLLAPIAANAFTTNNVPPGTELIDISGVVDDRSPAMMDIARIGNKPGVGSVMSTNNAVTNFNWNVIAQDKLNVSGQKWAVLSSVGETPGGASFNIFTNDFIRNATNLVLGIIGRPKIAPPAAPAAPAAAKAIAQPIAMDNAALSNAVIGVRDGLAQATANGIASSLNVALSADGTEVEFRNATNGSTMVMGANNVVAMVTDVNTGDVWLTHNWKALGQSQLIMIPAEADFTGKTLDELLEEYNISDPSAVPEDVRAIFEKSIARSEARNALEVATEIVEEAKKRTDADFVQARTVAVAQWKKVEKVLTEGGTVGELLDNVAWFTELKEGMLRNAAAITLLEAYARFLKDRNRNWYRAQLLVHILGALNYEPGIKLMAYQVQRFAEEESSKSVRSADPYEIHDRYFGKLLWEVSRAREREVLPWLEQMRASEQWDDEHQGKLLECWAGILGEAAVAEVERIIEYSQEQRQLPLRDAILALGKTGSNEAVEYLKTWLHNVEDGNISVAKDVVDAVIALNPSTLVKDLQDLRSILERTPKGQEAWVYRPMAIRKIDEELKRLAARSEARELPEETRSQLTQGLKERSRSTVLYVTQAWLNASQGLVEFLRSTAQYTVRGPWVMMSALAVLGAIFISPAFLLMTLPALVASILGPIADRLTPQQAPAIVLDEGNTVPAPTFYSQLGSAAHTIMQPIFGSTAKMPEIVASREAVWNAVSRLYNTNERRYPSIEVVVVNEGIPDFKQQYAAGLFSELEKRLAQLENQSPKIYSIQFLPDVDGKASIQVNVSPRAEASEESDRRVEMRIDGETIQKVFAQSLEGSAVSIQGPLESNAVFHDENWQRVSEKDRAKLLDILANGSDPVVLAKYDAKLSGEWGPKRTILVPLEDPVTAEVQVGDQLVSITYTTFKIKGANIQAGKPVESLVNKDAKQPSVFLDIQNGMPKHHNYLPRPNGAQRELGAVIEDAAIARHNAILNRNYTVNLRIARGTLTNKTFSYIDAQNQPASEKLGYVVSLITDENDQRFYHQIGPKLNEFFDRWQAKVMSGSVTSEEKKQIEQELKQIQSYFKTYGRVAREFNQDSFHSSLSPGNLNFIKVGDMEVPNIQDIDYAIPHSVFPRTDRLGFFINEVYMLLEGIHEFENPVKPDERGRHPTIYRNRHKEVFAFYRKLNEMGLEVNFQKTALDAYFQKVDRSLSVTDLQGQAIGTVGNVLDVMFNFGIFNSNVLDAALLAPGHEISRGGIQQNDSLLPQQKLLALAVLQVFQAEFMQELRPETRSIAEIIDAIGRQPVPVKDADTAFRLIDQLKANPSPEIIAEAEAFLSQAKVAELIDAIGRQPVPVKDADTAFRLIDQLKANPSPEIIAEAEAFLRRAEARGPIISDDREMGMPAVNPFTIKWGASTGVSFVKQGFEKEFPAWLSRFEGGSLADAASQVSNGTRNAATAVENTHSLLRRETQRMTNGGTMLQAQIDRVVRFDAADLSGTLGRMKEAVGYLRDAIRPEASAASLELLVVAANERLRNGNVPLAEQMPWLTEEVGFWNRSQDQQEAILTRILWLRERSGNIEKVLAKQDTPPSDRDSLTRLFQNFQSEQVSLESRLPQGLLAALNVVRSEAPGFGVDRPSSFPADLSPAVFQRATVVLDPANITSAVGLKIVLEAAGNADVTLSQGEVSYSAPATSVREQLDLLGAKGPLTQEQIIKLWNLASPRAEAREMPEAFAVPLPERPIAFEEIAEAKSVLEAVGFVKNVLAADSGLPSKFEAKRFPSVNSIKRWAEEELRNAPKEGPERVLLGAVFLMSSGVSLETVEQATKATLPTGIDKSLNPLLTMTEYAPENLLDGEFVTAFEFNLAKKYLAEVAQTMRRAEARMTKDALEKITGNELMPITAEEIIKSGGFKEGDVFVVNGNVHVVVNDARRGMDALVYEKGAFSFRTGIPTDLADVAEYLNGKWLHRDTNQPVQPEMFHRRVGASAASLELLVVAANERLRNGKVPLAEQMPWLTEEVGFWNRSQDQQEAILTRILWLRERSGNIEKVLAKQDTPPSDRDSLKRLFQNFQSEQVSLESRLPQGVLAALNVVRAEARSIVQERQEFERDVMGGLSVEVLTWYKNTKPAFAAALLGDIFWGIVTKVGVVDAARAAEILTAYYQAKQSGKFNLNMYLNAVKDITVRNPIFEISSDPGTLIDDLAGELSDDEIASLAIHMLTNTAQEYVGVYARGVSLQKTFTALEAIGNMTDVAGKPIKERLRIVEAPKARAIAETMQREAATAATSKKGFIPTIRTNSDALLGQLTGMEGLFGNIVFSGGAESVPELIPLQRFAAMKMSQKNTKKIIAQNDISAELVKELPEVFNVAKSGANGRAYVALNNAKLAGLVSVLNALIGMQATAKSA